MSRYSNDASRHMNKQGNPTISAFFSELNMNDLQQSLKHGVHSQTRQRISNQSSDELYTVMLFVYASHEVTMSQLSTQQAVKHLNTYVLSELIPLVSSNVLQYMHYIKDASTLPVPLQPGTSTNTRGDNSFVYNSLN